MGGRGVSSSMKSVGSSGGYDYSDFSKSVVTETLYHGTNQDFDTFDVSKSIEGNGALFFADDEDYAEAMAEERGGGNIYDVKVNIQNPMTVTLPNNQFTDPTVERKYIEQAKEQGHDGVIFKEQNPDEFSAGTFYAVFSPKQVQIQDRRKV